MENEIAVQQPDIAEQRRVKTFNRNKWLFSAGGIGRDMSYQLISAFLLTYIQFGVSLSLVQFTALSLIIGIGGRIWDALNDPVMGAIIEGTHMKWGKFKPWILIGAVSSGAVIISMFNIRAFQGWQFVVFMSVMYFLWESTFTTNDIGYWSMLPSLSSKKHERNSVTTLTVIFAGVGAFAGQGLVILLTPGNVVKGYSLVSFIIVAALIGCQIMTSFGVKETPRTEAEKEAKISIKKMWTTIKNNDQVLWMTLSLFLYSLGSGLLVALAYNLYYLEIGYDSLSIVFIVIFGVCNVGANVIYPKLSKLMGRKKIQFYSALVAVVGYIGVALLGWWGFLPFNLITLSVFGVLIFCGQALFYMASIINITNCVEYNEYKQGERNEAVVSTLRPFMTKFASAVQYGITTLVLVASGVFILSQNISLMESQKGYLENIKNPTEQVQYILGIQDYLDIFNEPANDGKEYDLFNEKLANDPAMAKYQLKAEYVESLNDCKIFREVIENNKVVEGSKTDMGFWRDVDEVELKGNENVSYKYSIEIVGSNFNAANANFKSKSNLGMRLWVRAAVTLVPILLIGAAWIIQQKKFIIDEKYYDEMVKTIEKRREEQGITIDD